MHDAVSKKKRGYMYVQCQSTRVPFLGHASFYSAISVLARRRKLGGVWEQSFSAVLEECCSILKYCIIIYRMVFGKLAKISVFKTEVLQIL
jgi:hypothetical protein